MSFPTMLLIKLGQDEIAPVTATAVNRELLAIKLSQISEVYEVAHQAQRAAISPEEGIQRLAQIFSERPGFGSIGMFVGYILFALGLGMLLQLTPQELLLSEAFGALVAILIIFSQIDHNFHSFCPWLQRPSCLHYSPSEPGKD
jgi:uncharacterized membrane protein YjjP (DUF1212 family)